MARFFVAILALFAVGALAAPVDDAAATAEVATSHCANEAGDVCPEGFTCCGPIFEDVGGICRKLGPDEICIF
ncbi:hypothetical protein FA15DRAFT_704919 [Coprinopsis marcescibilis]|uniref:Uncharacterized protein n=1 Tax=Coprinopsis marcescibilis TaxID=230819 RepID=A0A5C3KTV7_COPMA|nr:hypothetical protein FA15DRAFT_704919 [Coprinopsis marcescibilis]